MILGLCSFAFLASTIVAAGTFGDYLGELLRKKGTGATAIWFKRACGAVVTVAGLLQAM